MKDMENYIIGTLEVWSDWAHPKNIEIPKDKYSHFEIVLRYGGEHDGSLSWYLEAKKYKDQKVVLHDDFNLCYRSNAVRCFLDLPVKHVRTYDNINGLRVFFTHVAKEIENRKS